ncbi:hypothetical protein HBH56_218310 [Parastagonospora nodorum]|uniref:Uncharacterized protein n=1 Tax=Phaeosphaeria nodorum (strain SN15 / ATCC MYA-4574 / FGSC 10173) TaxID=321614 RepID=A0A7U2NP50_PHANO|nr:hypothetical protein HBH56_218310 [Parastagonospora nodorum]QRD05416.1 hypothetical protein JI435_309340 [Parastagonospora nodorum SN15]KAH3922783.1 hypothetical protein HBH54_220170 [Parastagonospora nodorum]KAH3958100.1 hypothetical protein HBH51_213720 [Parastagonospora nodorum]KAH3961539.1 hypothetical protein HBH52_231020 [Parastagonospora nodorum]
MSDLSQSGAPSGGLSTTAIAAIATGIGISLICIVALIFLLVRAIRNHKKLLADLEERGVSIAQARGEVRDSVTRPRSVLRRNTIHPYNKNSGWGTLTSVETIKASETVGTLDHYVPPKPTEAMKKGSRLSWPFHTRRVSGHNIHLKKIKGSRLSTVLEDPKPSANVPVLRSSLNGSSRPLLLTSQPHGSRHSSSQSMLQHHSAFRNSTHEFDPSQQGHPASGTSYFRAGANDRLQRAKSFADVPSDPPERPQLRARSASMSGHISGIAPDVILPPLPLDIVRIKNEARWQGQLRRIPSKQSDSSFASVDTSILINYASPVMPPPAKRRPQKITKPRTRGSGSAGARPFRDSLDLRAKVLGLRHTPSTSPARPKTAPSEMEERWAEHWSKPLEASDMQNMGNSKKARPVTVVGHSFTSMNTAASGDPMTPKRKLRSHAYSEDSPERQKRSTGRESNGIIRSPKRQHSQASSRSSGGNPFQWDPTPLSSTGKPSALKGSPSARQGHRRKNSVRISLVPTFHGPPTRTPSPSFIIENKEDITEGATVDRSTAGLGLAIPGPRALPTPPSSSTFAPELKFPTTSLRASLTPSSPTLPLVSYDQTYVVFPTDHVLNELAKLEGKRASNSSVISFSKPLRTPSGIESWDDDSYTLVTRSSDRFDFSRDYQMPETPFLPQSPFKCETTEQEQSFPFPSLSDLDMYDPERPSMVFQTPTNTSSRAWHSDFATIPEESSVSSQKTVEMNTIHQDDSPPVSPKTMSPPRFSLNDRAAYNLPVYATTIPEETPDTTNPAILSKDAFVLLNNSFNDVDSSIMDTAYGTSSNLALVIPKTSELAQKTFDPLLEAAFPFDLQPIWSSESPILGHRQSEASSIYSLPSPLETLSPTSPPIEIQNPVMPCSPRPSHVELPQTAPSLAIDFSDMPKLSPSPRGPPMSSPRPLRASIAALRRMNSDAANAKKEKAGRGERRYLRLGREDSVALPDDESWLDEMDDATSIELDEAEGRRQVENALDEWDEGCASIDLDEGSSLLSTSTVTPDTEIFSTSIEQDDTTAGAQERSSNIWEDGETFWASSTPPRPSSPNKQRDKHQPCASSPLVSPIYSISSVKTIKNKKRDFEVAKDISRSPSSSPTPKANRKKHRNSGDRYRKRNALGVGTPNVRIQVTSPSGRILTGTSGSLYDSQGFLRY